MKQIKIYRLFLITSIFISNYIYAGTEHVTDVTYHNRLAYNVKFTPWESSNKDNGSISQKEYKFYSQKGDILSFDWWTSSEQYCDKLVCMLDGSIILTESGVEKNGSYQVVIDSDGTHSLTLIYSKDFFSSDGSDCVGISNIILSRYYTDIKTDIYQCYYYCSGRSGEFTYENSIVIESPNDVVSLQYTDYNPNWGYEKHTVKIFVDGVEYTGQPLSIGEHTVSLSYSSFTYSYSDKLMGSITVNSISVSHQLPNVVELAEVDESTHKYVSADSEIGISSLLYTRTFNNCEWQALYVPFQMSYEDWCDDFDVAKINNFHQYDMDNDDEFDTLELEIIKVNGGALKANHPYLIRAKDVGEKTIKLKNTTLHVAEENSFVCNSMETQYTFTGTYAGMSGADMYTNNYYSMGGGALINAEDDTADLKPYRWYLQMTDREGQVVPAPSRIRVMVWDGQTTSVETLSLSNEPTHATTLDGRTVKDIKARGIYIVNGKKVLR